MKLTPGENFFAKKFSPGPSFQKLPTYRRLPLVAASLKPKQDTPNEVNRIYEEMNGK